MQVHSQMLQNLELSASINRSDQPITCGFSVLRCHNLARITRNFGLDFAQGRGAYANGHGAIETMSSSLSPVSLVDVISSLRNMGCVCARERITIDGHTYTVREQFAEG